MTINSIQWLQNWTCKIKSASPFSWPRVQIENLDNPGWDVTIDLRNTDFETLDFVPFQSDRQNDDWVFCKIEDMRFRGAGGPKNLTEVIEFFRNQIETKFHLSSKDIKEY